MIQRFVSLPERGLSSADRICMVWSPDSAAERSSEVYALVHRLFNEERLSSHSLLFLIAEDVCRLGASLLQLVDEQRWDLVREAIPRVLDLIQACVDAHPAWEQRLEVVLARRKLEALRSWVN